MNPNESETPKSVDQWMRENNFTEEVIAQVNGKYILLKNVLESFRAL